ncbi:MAG: hypothetical protein WA876_01710 [Candidatus Acidiferrales bacterium]
MTSEKSPPKKEMILSAARELKKAVYTPAEIEQIRRKLIAERGEAGKTSTDYIADVLAEAKMRVVLLVHVDPEGQYEEEFQDLLHFATLEEAEVCLVRLDELLRKFETEGSRAGEARVLEVARLGRRRAEMISRNRKVDAIKRKEKEEVARWFSVWLEQPDAFFDWLEIRKQSPEFRERFPQGQAEAE